MDSSIANALVIALIGMSLLFVSLVFFYGLLALMTAVFRDTSLADRRKTKARSGEEETGAHPEAVLRAAAVAVALARAEAEERSGPTILAAPAEARAEKALSPWWSLHHQRQLGPHPNVWRVR